MAAGATAPNRAPIRSPGSLTLGVGDAEARVNARAAGGVSRTSMPEADAEHGGVPGGAGRWDRPGLLLGYAATPEPEIIAGVRRLAAAL